MLYKRSRRITRIYAAVATYTRYFTGMTKQANYRG